MPVPAVNPFKQKLLRGEPQFGLFCMSLTAQTAEALSSCGFDFLMFDAEHTPTSLPTLYTQALALAASTTQCLVRMPSLDPVLFKPVLDLAIDTVMVPNIRTAEEARAAVRAVRYPPHGIRGVGGSVRATGYGRHADYYAVAADRVCLLLQIESAEGLRNLDAICAVDGVDGLFIGPVDLATDMGHLAQATHPQVVEAALDGVRRIRAAGKAAGILAAEAQAAMYVDAGANVVCLGSDLGVLVRNADALAARWVRAEQAP
ncbi:4-hydroxy-2-oxo-heptane-1,7-dioate aldolase [Ramlibacter ginsenosidimutans]|uniref:4-hydroxy-2-oxo-heptane-1,7-dioate aldolase n=1 Tax=Ramlibacter ginsenosidimutans TaxID=502333 RepID=A0A934WMW7_9BURK|nr:4-hydroxy-2-oxo-heptane-1,7-dioate aldolase [Ramlibacter ginsenosidimutans]